MNILEKIVLAFPDRLRRTASHAICFGLGIVLAVLLHYVLYRLGLPSKPFIYVAF
jgi:hypothetical protein